MDGLIILVSLVIVILVVVICLLRSKKVTFGRDKILSFDVNAAPCAVGKKKRLEWMRMNMPLNYRRIKSEEVVDYDHDLYKQYLDMSPDIYAEIAGQVPLKHKQFIDKQFINNQMCDHISDEGFTSQ